MDDLCKSRCDENFVLFKQLLMGYFFFLNYNFDKHLKKNNCKLLIYAVTLIKMHAVHVCVTGRFFIAVSS